MCKMYLNYTKTKKKEKGHGAKYTKNKLSIFCCEEPEKMIEY